MAGPGAVLILQLEELGLHVAVPLRPRRPTGSAQAVTYIEVGKKLLASDGAETCNEALVAELVADFIDLLRVLFAVTFGTAELLELLRLPIERHTGGCFDGHAHRGRSQTSARTYAASHASGRSRGSYAVARHGCFRLRAG